MMHERSLIQHVRSAYTNVIEGETKEGRDRQKGRSEHVGKAFVMWWSDVDG